jgi:Na+/phosphate symporter
MMHSLSFIANPCFEHVDNNHSPLTEFQAKSLTDLTKKIKEYIKEVVGSISTSDYSNSEKLIKIATDLNEQITQVRKKQLKILKKEPGSTRTNMLFMDILNETKNSLLFINNIFKSFRDFAKNNQTVTFRNI